jgi:site-specific DNA-methyltransferase (adenine-specific)
MRPISEVHNEDCMIGMSRYPDKFFDLAIVDPPYGIDINSSGRLVAEKGWEYKDWDKGVPKPEYFTELKRVSKNQIIWGGNYFEDLGSTRGFVIWDKQQPEGVSFASCEFAWTSFDRSAKTFYHRPQGDIRIHPTQKPIKLYNWLLHNYAKAGDKVLDTHMGSQSSRVSAFNKGFDYWGWEIDKEYFEKGNQRFKEQTAQIQLF